MTCCTAMCDFWSNLHPVIQVTLKGLAVIMVIFPLAGACSLAERKVSAWMQGRPGPNRAIVPWVAWIPFLGKFLQRLGVFHLMADGAKFLFKEEPLPGHVNKLYFLLAPAIALVPALTTVTVVPFGAYFNELGALVPLALANVDLGLLAVFAVSSLGVYSVILAGWASNSKYPFLGGIRSTSQMISYELALGLSVIPVFMLCGTLNMPDIVNWQRENGWMVAPFWAKGLTWEMLLSGDFKAVLDTFVNGFSLSRLLIWIPMLISFIIFLIAMFAETNRAPFDLPEAEQELVGGYHTEYSGMGFALFFLGEYAAMIAGSGVIVTLFLGGWSLPMIPDGSMPGLPGVIFGLINIGVFFAKVSALLVLFIWVRWTVPRFRYDQLMKLGWYFFFELALVNIFITAFVLAYIK